MNQESRIKNKIKTNKKSGSYRDSCFLIRDSSAPPRRGFSIVETIVAIAILSIAIVAPLTLAQRGLNSSVYARDQVTAFYLAQEAIEYVHYLRDTNNLLGRSQGEKWLSDFNNPSYKWGLDITVSVNRIYDCTADLTLCQLHFNPDTGVYGRPQNPNWRSTIFTRILVIVPVTINGDSNAGAELTATVSWQAGTIPRSVVIKEKIFDWFPTF